MHPNPEDQKCCFHPQHIIIGVCVFCLNERLLILKHSKQEQLKNISSRSFNLPKFFAFTSLLSRFDNHKHNKKTQDYDHGSYTSTSQEDSFISIKFEGSGVGSWDKMSTKPKALIEQHQHDNYISSFNQILIKGVGENRAVIEHSKPRGPLRWQKRIGHIFQIIRLKKPTGSKGIGHVPSHLEGHVKVRHSWMKSLKKRAN